MPKEVDDRRHLRIQEEFPIRWLIEGRTGFREGIVRDISSSGMLIEIELATPPRHNLIIRFEPLNEEEIKIFPKKAELVWYKRMRTKPNHYLCGAEFIDASEGFLDYIQVKLEAWLRKLAKASNVNILKNYLFKNE